MDFKLLRQAFGKFPTGVTVVTWFDDVGINGITVNSFTSVSLEPPLALISIDKKANSYEQLQNKPFTINVLADDQEAIAWQFAGRPQEELDISWNKEGDSPSIAGASGYFKCKHWKQYDAGDHVLFVGEITEFDRRSGDSLTFFEGKMGSTEMYKSQEVQ
ncbi:flavin reductase family protein [Solibacillus sp. MA9]|uniref:Flavin reductase family protein n=1 Tax=Solibacillus palustris TaxID=2908203 RepID=A0ABS9U826_9BACL|nr:flavin reductase family protein [Solibacillus sp. MA9]MCH7320398.1 flavin reductase family protein [Solibacillus sp. MA9]